MLKKLIMTAALVIPALGVQYAGDAGQHKAEAAEKQVSLSSNEKDLLARLVTAEAKGEPYAGQVAVATVVLNRLDSDKFPDSLKGIVYQKNEFSPVLNGSINDPATSEAKKAVDEAINFHGKGQGSLFFYNPDKTDNQWLRGKHETIKIGEHVFAK
ncbi:cell wall hydrolase [Priestia koreensis]|uniref:Cell wall hydrolase SleB domain-containing protein n=1 Tax=Priestia koreensis TaxID=284581 RepID=A0A0M0KWN6_9BACI|nr:cell wall hydrolase [Priestia koreensis]KOO42803.1 hypothetical protein AMD01_16805 [Priestia koreensis]UNL86653.1 cell wall hydrolase [Priestia koreensis]